MITNGPLGDVAGATADWPEELVPDKALAIQHFHNDFGSVRAKSSGRVVVGCCQRVVVDAWRLGRLQLRPVGLSM